MSTELEAELQGSDPTAVLREFLSEAAPSSVYHLVDLPWPYIASLTEAATEFDPAELPELRLLGRRETLVSLRQSFLGAARAANLVEADRLAVREREPTGDTPLIVGEERVHVPLLLDGTGAAVVATRGSFAEQAGESVASAWEGGEPFSLRTPALERIRDTMASDLGSGLKEDFDQSLARAATQRDPGDFEPVTAAVVVAAANGTLHYDLSRWGESVGLASKATFSRRKGELEDMDVITTEKVPVEMGRPRQRLHLTDEYDSKLGDHGVDELVARIAG
ncbi:DUF5821 family protein [Halobaculum sp. MBLA0143]|uniref:transcriptional regulator TbsP domain-containing protein n=1 Tax=Halobaculum sp. MBLA0143 TaxID=3079933 RepID=UPI0035233753